MLSTSGRRIAILLSDAAMSCRVTDSFMPIRMRDTMVTSPVGCVEIWYTAASNGHNSPVILREREIGFYYKYLLTSSIILHRENHSQESMSQLP